MLALHWDGKALSLQQKPIPTPVKGESLIRVLKAGICNTDLEITRGYAGFTGTPGHEFVGQVVQSDQPALVDTRVVCDINFSCGQCNMCHIGQPHHCYQRKTLGIRSHDGCFAEYLCAPTHNLVKVPDEVSTLRASFAEPFAAALEIAEQISLASIPRAAVIGDGKLGLLITLALQQSGIKLTLVGHHEENYALVRRPGIDFSSSPPAQKFPLVVEASGNPAGFEAALGMVEPKGTLVLKSTYPGNVPVNLAALVVNEINLLGSRCGPMEKAVSLFRQQETNPEVIVEAEYSLTEAVKAFEHAASKGARKILINCAARS